MIAEPEYKQTELGPIPADWDVKRLGDLGKIVRGGSPRPAGDSRYFDGSFVPWLTVGSLTNIPSSQLYVTSTATMLTQEGSKRSRFLPRETLVIVNSGARTLGVSKILALECCANDGIAALVDQTHGNRLFICYVINSQIDHLRQTIAAGNDQLNLNTGRIRLMAIPFPPEREQRLIAEALSDVDALLGVLDRLIAKKRDLKQATMQQLLSGRTRLTGFAGEWETCRLQDCVSFLRNGVASRAELGSGQGVRYLHYGDIHAAPGVRLDASSTVLPTLARERAQRLERLRDGDLVLVDASEDQDGVGKAVEISGTAGIEVVAGLHTIAARFDKTVLVDGFKAYLPFIPTVRAHLRRLAAGTKVLATSRGHIVSIEVQLPGTDEQLAIATVLSDMEAELDAIQARRVKTAALKQGMMQELLTGRTRLV